MTDADERGSRSHGAVTRRLGLDERLRRAIGFLRDSLDPWVRSDFAWTGPGPRLPSLYRLRKLLWSKDRRPVSALSLE